MRVLFTVFYTCLFCLSHGQFLFPEKPNVKVEADSTFYEYKGSSFFSYYTNTFDSLFIPFEAPILEQRIGVDNISGYGYFIILYQNQILFRYEIKEFKISGIGYKYYTNSQGKVLDFPYCQSMFKNNKLDGVTIFFNKKGIITEIVKFRNGKYCKYLYHFAAKTNKSLIKGNKKAPNPFTYVK